MKEKVCYKIIIDQFIDALESFVYLSKGSFEYVNRNIVRESKNMLAYYKKFFNYKEQLNEDDLKKDAVALRNIDNLAGLIKQAKKMSNISPYSMLVSLMSGFEYYIKQLLSVVCIQYPHAINCIDIKLDYNDFSLCEDKEEIRQYYINLFLEELFRPSLNNVFETIEKKFNICKFKNITYYKELLLIAEFRNIIVHNDGNAGLIFKANTKKLGLNQNLEKYFSKNRLRISPGILSEFINLMTLSAVEICVEFIDHYLPKDYENRDDYLYRISDLCIGFLYTSQKSITLDAYSIILKKKLNPDTKNFFIFNSLLSKKVVDKYQIKENDFSSIDWDYCNNTHYFAKYILLGDFETAMNYCDLEGKDKWDEIFQCWPMCKPLVISDIFNRRYAEIFGSEFASKIIDWTNTPDDISDAINELNNIFASRTEIKPENKNMLDSKGVVE